MKRWFIESWLLLVYFDCLMRFSPFAKLYSTLRQCSVLSDNTQQPSVATLTRAMDFACVFYVKPVLCLQRSAATMTLLRRHGWPAEMVIGAQLLPFRSHAWVEVERQVVNDKPYMSEIFMELERCEAR